MNGSIYIFNNEYFLNNFSIREKKGNYFFHEKKYSLDLDDLDDLKNFGAKYYLDNKKRLKVNAK